MEEQLLNPDGPNMRRLFAVLVGALVAGCAATPVGGPLQGTVIDGATGASIAGAYVIAFTRLRGTDGVGSRSTCVDPDVVATDAMGRYRVTSGEFTLNSMREIVAYAPGYADAPDSWSNSSIKLIKFNGTGDERKASLQRYTQVITCGPPKEIAPKVRGLFQAIDDEDRQLVLTRPRASPPGSLMEGLRAIERAEK